MAKYKTGRLSQEERAYIRENWIDQEPDDIAGHLNRRPVSVKKFAKQVGLTRGEDAAGLSDSQRILADLHDGTQWTALKKQFNKEELVFFEESWVSFVKQFNKDVLPTECFQIATVITMEILVNRNMQDRQEVSNKILKLRADKEDILQQMAVADKASDSFMALSEMAQLSEIQIANAESSIQSRSVEYKDLVEKKRQHYRELKGTRDQRFKQLEDSRTNYMDWFKELDERDTMEREGREMGLRLEAEKLARAKLTEFHEFQDGLVDKPILVPEDV